MFFFHEGVSYPEFLVKSNNFNPNLKFTYELGLETSTFLHAWISLPTSCENTGSFTKVFPQVFLHQSYAKFCCNVRPQKWKFGWNWQRNSNN